MDAITKLSDLDKLEFNISQIELFRNDHARQTLSTIVNQKIIDVIHSRMRGFNYSPKIIDRTFLERIDITSAGGDAEIHIKSDYTSESGFEVASAREKGTARHKIEPKDPTGVLSFLINGQRVYSKGHFVEGIVGSHIIESTIQQNTEDVQAEFQRVETQWVIQTLAK